MDNIQVKDCDDVYSESNASDYRIDQIEVDIDNKIQNRLYEASNKNTKTDFKVL